MAASQFFSLYKYPITLKPLTFPDYKETYNDIFNLQNSFRILIHQLDATFEKAVPEAPKDGTTYGRKDGAWEAITGGGTSLAVATTTLSVGTSNLTTGKSAIILAAYSDVPARIRLYSTGAGRTLDAGRAVGTKATKEATLIFEFVTVAGFLGAPCNPVPIADNWDSPTNSYVYANVESTGSPTVTITYIQLIA